MEKEITTPSSDYQLRFPLIHEFFQLKRKKLLLPAILSR